jgi:hypothetical protein
MTDFTDLSIAGRVATPDDADWDEARLAWNLAADLRPSAVAKILPPDVCERLAEVRRQWDPEGRVVANHAVSLGEA